MVKRLTLEHSAPVAAPLYSEPSPLSTEELEAGLHILRRETTDQGLFWDHNIVAFRQTVLAAIRETSEFLSKEVPSDWSAELDSQLKSLREYLALADRYICSSRLN